MAVELGTAYLSVVPSTRGFGAALKAAIKTELARVAKTMGDQFKDDIQEGIARGVESGVEKGFKAPATRRAPKTSGEDAGESYGGAFDKAMRKKVTAALKSLPEAEIGVATTKAEQKLKDLRGELEDLSHQQVGVDISDKEALAKIHRIQGELDALGAQSASVQVKADVGAASVQLAAIAAQAEALDGKDVEVSVKANGLSRLNGLAGQTSLTLGQTALAAGALGSALVPVAAAAGGLGAALAAPVLSATGGLTVYGFLTGAAVSKTNEQLKDIDTARKKLSGLEKGTEEYAAAQKDLKQKLAALTPAQERYRDALDGMKAALGRLIDTNGGDLLNPLTKGIRLLSDVMGDSKPIIHAVSGALMDLLGDVRGFTKSAGYDSFISFFAVNAPDAMKSFAKIAGNVAVGVGNIVDAAAPFGRGVLDTFVRFSREFKQFGQSADDANSPVQKFLSYVQRVGPNVWLTLGDVAEAFGDVVVAAAPIGEATLPIIRGLANVISAIAKTPGGTQLVAFAAGLLAINKAMALYTAVKGSALVGAMGKMSKLRMGAMAAGLGAMALGVGKLGDKSTTAGKAVNVLANAAAGALAGAGFGPWGAVIGGAGGALLALTSNSQDASTAQREFARAQARSKANSDALKASLDQTTGAITKQTKVAMAKAISENDELQIVMQSTGLSLKTMTRAALGNKKAMNVVAIATRTWNKSIGGNNLSLHGLNNTLRGLGAPMRRQIELIKKTHKAASDGTKGTKGLDRALSELPAKVITKLAQPGMVKSREDIEDLKEKYDLTPKQVSTLFKVLGIKRAKGDVDNLNGSIDNLPDKKVVQIILQGVNDLQDAIGGVFGSGKGPGQGHASGGLITGPGTGTSDSIPARLSNGEFVMRAAAVDHYGAGTLAAMNRNRFAAGGLVGAAAGQRDRLQTVLTRLVRVLRDVADALEESGRGGYYLPDTTPHNLKPKTNGRHLGLPHESPRPNVGGFLQQQTPKPDFLKKTVKGVKRDTVGMEMAVGKSAKKIGKYWTTVKKKDLPSLQKRWHKTMQGGALDANMLDKSTRKNTSQIGKSFLNFRRGPLSSFAKDWGNRLRSETPGDVSVFRSKTVDQMGKTRDGINHVWRDQVKPTFRDFGSFPKKSVAPMFRDGTKAIGDAWSKITKRTGKPISATIAGPINDGLVKAFNKIAKFVDADKFPKLDVPKFSAGGYTGDGAKFEPKGVVHGGEFVINKASTSKLERHKPGLLASLNGYAKGGKVTSKYHAPVPYSGTYPVDSDDAARAGVDWAYDIPVPEGTPVSSAWDGRISVVANEGDTSYGKWIEVANHGFQTRFAHLSRQLAHVGQMVKSGELIGYSGNTGGSSGPHLHFEGDHGAPPIGAPSGKGPIGGPGMGPMLPAWAQKIVGDAKGWAKGLLQSPALKGSAFGGNAQGMLDKLASPIAKWAMSKLGGAGAAGNFGPGAAGVWKSLMSTGFYSPQQAAGVMGNMQAESGFVPNIVQGGGRSWNPASAGSSGYGLVQWTPGSKLLPYLHGQKPTIAAQVSALTSQLRGQGPSAEGAAGSALKTARTPEQAARIFGLEYERYAGGVQSGREDAARAIFERFKGTHDKGGLFPAKSFAFNGTSSTEAVFTERQWGKLSSFIPDPDGRGGSRNTGWVEVRITNWQSGKAMMRGQAGTEMAAQAGHDRLMRRM